MTVEERLNRIEKELFESRKMIRKGDYIKIGGILFRCYNEKETLCTTVDVLSTDIIEDIIDGKRLSDGHDVRYNNDVTDDSWKNSIPRRILNNKFRQKYLKNIEIEDEVRLLTKEEIEGLDNEFHNVSDWYWTMTSNTDEEDFSARVFFVYGSSNPGYLDWDLVNLAYGVRPVVSLKSNALVSGTGASGNPFILVKE